MSSRWWLVAGVVMGCAALIVVSVWRSADDGAAAVSAVPVAETPAVTSAEDVLAAYAAGHTAWGAVVGCQDRIFGEADSSGGSRRVYAELMCATLAGKPPCLGGIPSAFEAPAVADIAPTGVVSGFAVDTKDDSGYAAWVSAHVPARWQHLEHDGPVYGSLLQSRLAAHYACPGGATSRPGPAVSP